MISPAAEPENIIPNSSKPGFPRTIPKIAGKIPTKTSGANKAMM